MGCLWRYREALPIVHDANIVSLGEPLTPLVLTGISGLHLKLDFMFPTASFKDRGASVLLSKVKELGIDEVVEDSSGNAGAAIAAYSARAGVRCRIFIPAGTSRNKVRQIELFGAELTAALENRRDHLDEAAERLYEIVFRHADVHGTDEVESAHVDYAEDGSVTVTLEATGFGTTFARRFHPAETDEVRLYLHGGGDTVTLDGDASDAVGASWRADGTLVFTRRLLEGLWILSPGTAAVPLTGLRAEQGR